MAGLHFATTHELNESLLQNERFGYIANLFNKLQVI